MGKVIGYLIGLFRERSSLVGFGIDGFFGYYRELTDHSINPVKNFLCCQGVVVAISQYLFWQQILQMPVLVKCSYVVIVRLCFTYTVNSCGHFFIKNFISLQIIRSQSREKIISARSPFWIPFF